MTRGMFAGLLCAVLFLALGARSSEPKVDGQEVEAVTQEMSARVVQQQAEEAGVVLGRMFEFDLARAQFASQLLEKGVSGATCQIVCPRNRVGGISCPVGQPCQCSCPGDYPDCTCRP